jgi:hypothetical protein
MTDPDVPTPAEISENLPFLLKLAELLLGHRASPDEAIIVPFIGAGASISANLPSSAALQSRIYAELVQQQGNDSLAQFLDEEARALFPVEAQHGLLRLSLFEFAAVISRFAYARKMLRQVILSVMTQATHRPLAYELLAHLAKHGHVDHFVSLNFDELLDAALGDELPDRLRFISSTDDLPGPRFARETKPNACYLFKPFGTLATDTYKLEVEDVRQYGSKAIWRFMLDSVFRPAAGNLRPEVILILVGYAAAEPAFSQLITELLADGERTVTIFAIDPRPDLPHSLKSLRERKNCNVRHIGLDADTAFDLVLRIMKIKYLTVSPYRTWIPIARHRIVSTLPYRSIANPELRFKMELILQAIKSRGFFTIEAAAEIDRIRKYDQRACAVLQEMCDAKFISPQPNTSARSDGSENSLRQVYLLQNFGHDHGVETGQEDFRVISENLLNVYSLRSPDPITEWEVKIDDSGAYTARARKISHRDFLEKRFKEIAGAPEIEVSSEASPSSHWLFRNARLLPSVTRLTEETAALFNLAIRDASVSSIPSIEVYGIWTTGEWLFHDDGWAWSTIGKELVSLMSSGRLRLSMILARNPIGKSVRLNRGTAVLERLAEPIKQGHCSVQHINWWQQNRAVTLLYWAKGAHKQAGGIYMRRRLATPLVAPFRVEGSDCDVLRAIFDSYQLKSQATAGEAAQRQLGPEGDGRGSES